MAKRFGIKIIIILLIQAHLSSTCVLAGQLNLSPAITINAESFRGIYQSGISVDGNVKYSTDNSI